MGVRFLGIGRHAANLKDRIKDLRGDFESRETAVEGVLDRISGVSEQAYASADDNPFDADMTAEQRFGDMIDFQTDQINQNQAGAQNAIQTALMASGGDVSGSGALALQEFTEGANNAIGEALNYYTGLNKQVNRSNRRLNLSNKQFEEGRGDRLMLSELGGQQNLMNMTLSQLLSKEKQNLMRRQANKQLFADIIGSIASVGKSAMAPGAGK